MEDINSKGRKGLLLNKMSTSLLELGLNKYEEKVYLTLVEEGVSSAKNLSNITGIPYGKVYEVLNNLSMKGWLVILPAKPMKFQAVSPKEVIANTRKNMQEQLNQLEERMIKELEPVFTRTKKFVDQKSMFWIINGRANINNKFEEFLAKAQKEINILVSENGLKRLVMFRDPLKEAKKRGVNINLSAVLTKGNKEDAQDLDFCNLKDTSQAKNHFISIDGQECLVIDPIADDENLVYGRDVGVWVSSSSFTHFLDDFFHTNFAGKK